MAAVVDDLATAVRAGRAWRRANVLDPWFRFRFSDVNPLTGRPYAQSRFRDLPEFAADVVADQVMLEPGEWDVLVEDGEAYDFVGYHDSYGVPGHQVRAEICSDCSGTGLAAPSSAGSITREQRCDLCRGAGAFWVMARESARRTSRPVEETMAVVA